MPRMLGFRRRLVWSIAGSVLLLAGCRELFTPPAPKCAEGQHVSGGKCCDKGYEWVPARQRCLCIDHEICGKPEAQRAETAAAAAGADAAAGAQAAAGGHPCTGSWKGTIRSTEGRSGKLALSISAVEPGTVERPHSRTCGRASESWGGEDRCRLRLVRCSYNRDILIAVGAASEASDCGGPISVALDCKAQSAQYRRAEEDLAVSGTVAREVAAPAKP